MLRRSPKPAEFTSARCGRCGDLLPDETMTYCPACGIPFSKVPPTAHYSTLFERKARTRRLREQTLALSLSACIFAVLGFLFYSYAHVQLKADVARLKPVRELVVYEFDHPQFPALSAVEKRLALATGLQAFQDHFGVALERYEYHSQALPDEMKDIFSGPWRPAYEAFSFWTETMLLKFAARSGQSLSTKLPVILTNVPIFVDEKAKSSVETRHIHASGLVAGVGSPAYVLVSSYRLLTRQSQLALFGAHQLSSEEKAKYLGEFLLAHELGHAILGLSDYVTSTDYRAPASLPADSKECLMHTDAGGGLSAWEGIRRRKLGEPSRCHAYDQTLSAFRHREQAIQVLRDQRISEARELFLRSLRGFEASASPWLTSLVKKEENAFLSVFDRWLKFDFVFQSRGNDQL